MLKSSIVKISGVKWLFEKHIRVIVITLLVVCGFSINTAFADDILKGGTLTENEIWTSDNTYIVYQDVLVPESISLIIMPGTEIRIKYGMGITVDRGSIDIGGTESDRIRFVPDHSHPSHTWKWEGLTIRHANDEIENNIEYADFENAETALVIEESYGVIVDNVKVTGCQNLGVEMINSSYCYIVNSEIVDNYDGIEILAGFLGQSSNNIIYNCVIRNENQNVYVFREDGGLYISNLISTNVISDGTNGIWIGNNGDNVNSENVIERNVFVNNGSQVGYGLFLAHDSTIVRNNIFWNNNIAVYCEDEGDNSQLYNNSFYENNWAIAMGARSVGNIVSHNSFSLNNNEVIGIKEANRFKFDNNNMFYNDGKQNIVVNHTNIDLLIDSNYWGKNDSLAISNLIFDYYDNPSLGKLNFMPFFIHCDTTNPVAPPYVLKKQLVNENVRVMWDRNLEEDISGYRIHYGLFKDYSFSEYYDLQQDTVFVFSNDISIYDEIAVTAYDSGAIVNSGLLNGHESPYSFAVLYPYAGGDTLLCKNQTELYIIGSNVPMEYHSIQWITDGDGYFDDENIVNPTYFSGITDVQSGNVHLTIIVTTEESVFTDSFTLSIVDDPSVKTINDTLIMADSEVNLENTVAENYNSIIWETTGDGVFSNSDILNPIYTLGSGDTEKGSVTLVVNAVSSCGFAIDSVEVSILSHFSLEGVVWNDNNKYVGAAVVAYRKTEDKTRAFATVSSVEKGYFRFNKLMTGEYYIYSVPDTNRSIGILPGYYANKTHWSDSHIINVDADVYDVDIFLQKNDFNLPDGEGSISGTVESFDIQQYNHEIYCGPWLEYSDADFCVYGMSNITIFLYDVSLKKILNFTLTDNMGNFYFKNLPYGDYRLLGEKAGLESVSSYVINLNNENRSETDVVLQINGEKIDFANNQQNNSNKTNVYPNPVNDILHISYNSSQIDVIVEICDLSGKVVLVTKTQTSKNNQIINVNVSLLKKGLFTGRIISDNTTSWFKFLKN